MCYANGGFRCLADITVQPLFSVSNGDNLVNSQTRGIGRRLQFLGSCQPIGEALSHLDCVLAPRIR